MGEKRGYWQVEGDLTNEEATSAADSVIEAEAQGKSLIVVDGVTLRWVPPAGSLDAAWAEAEAALPEGYTLTLTFQRLRTVWAEARRGVLDDYQQFGEEADTPAAALRALAAKLREVGR